jgi:hypothetical protein
LDSNNELDLGNVYKTSVEMVAEGKPRRELIEKLMGKKFGEIGGPCATVHCCQSGIFAPHPWERLRGELSLVRSKISAKLPWVGRVKRRLESVGRAGI